MVVGLSERFVHCYVLVVIRQIPISGCGELESQLQEDELQSVIRGGL
jgi:hypothetical protein